MQQAKIAVAGATGRLGRHVVDVLSAAGQEVVPISRSAGVDVITGDGLAEAVKDTSAIIDVTAGPSSEQRPATEFFTTAARNLQQAGERAGVARYVVVSIIGIQQATGGYGSAKLAHEQGVLAGPVPARILRVAQFHELVGVLMDMGRQGDVIYLPQMRTQIIAARTAAEVLAAMAVSPEAEFAAARAAESAGAPIPELAGPREENLASLARLVAARRGDPVRIEEVKAADPDSEAAADGSLLPGPHAKLAGPTFEEWLATQPARPGTSGLSLPSAFRWPDTLFVCRRPRKVTAAKGGAIQVTPGVGLVGLGRMGTPICANLVRAGYRVQAGDRRPEAAELATRCGAQWVSPLTRLAAESDVLITVLPGPGEVRDLMLGPGGVLEVLRRGTTWIDMTSNSPAAMTGIQQRLLARGVQVLEAPVGGSIAAATQGTLQVLAGGDAEVFARQRDLLEILGDPGRIIHVGGYGAGYTAKLLINLLWFGQAVATAEALLLGQAAGLDLGVVRETLTQSAADSRFIRHDLDALFAGDFMRSFGLDRCYEELQTVTELAHHLGVPFQLSGTVADVYRRAVQRYGPADGELLSIALLEEQAGRTLRHPPPPADPIAE